MHTVDRAQDFSFSQTSSTLCVSQSQMWSPFYNEVQPLPSFPLQHIAGLPDPRLGADISFSSPLPSVYLQKGEGRYYVIRIPNQPIQFIQADKDIREEKEEKKKKMFRQLFFSPFLPLFLILMFSHHKHICGCTSTCLPQTKQQRSASCKVRHPTRVSKGGQHMELHGLTSLCFSCTIRPRLISGIPVSCGDQTGEE